MKESFTMNSLFNVRTECLDSNAKIDLSLSGHFCGSEIYSVKAVFNECESPMPFSLSFMTDNKNSYSVWSPLHCKDRCLYPGWRKELNISSDARFGLPLVQFSDKSGKNICTAALSDFTNPISISAGIDERSGKIEIKINFFNNIEKPCREYNVFLFLNTNKIPFYEAINCFNDYRKSFGYVSAFVPEIARRRTYSSWYAFQKDIDETRLYEQCVLAKKFGMNTVIIDDGWQTPISDSNSNAYITCGDWEPYLPKFHDMEAFVKKLHIYGIKVVLWIATPFIGSESKEFGLFKGKLLRKNREDGTVMVADPRFADVRRWYVKMLSDRMKNWNLDGFKLDFIDCFTLCEDSSLNYDEMDYPVLGEAITVLLDEITTSLRQINPDVMIEFRQPYIGPNMQKSGNMFRVEDCAYGAKFNRINGIDLRLIAPDSAIHSDMLMWDYDADVEAAADQLSALLFIVPQVSMLLDKLNDEHKKMLSFYLDFIDENRDVLQHGVLVPLYPEADYSVVFAHKNNKVIAALYSANSFEVPDGTEEFAIVNASGNEKVYIEVHDSIIGKKYIICNCMGEEISSGKIVTAVNSYHIPHNGILFFNN